jgi:hypothetical protein
MPAFDSYQRAGWSQVAETGQAWEAELIAGRLRASGINAEIVDQTFRQEPLPSVRAFSVVRIMVPTEHVDEAQRVLDQPLELPDDVEIASAEEDREPD